jgi:hypothetical protein
MSRYLFPWFGLKQLKSLVLTSNPKVITSTLDSLPGGIMSVRNAVVLLLALSCLLFLAACGSNGNSVANPVAPPSGAFSNSNLNGTYVFSVSGVDSNGAPYAMAGTFTFNGSGGNGKGSVTGTLDFNDAADGVAPAASITSGSTYSVGQDGRGEAVIGTNIGNGFPNLTFDFVLSSSSHGLITEFDSFGSGSGTLDLQAAGVTPTGSYAFSLSGASSSSGSSWATVGNFTLSGATLSGFDDFNESGIAFPASTLTGSLALGPSTTPSTTLNVASTSGGVFSGVFDAFAIDATHLKLIEMDTTATLSGDAYSQTSPTIAAGTLAFTLAGSEFAAGGLMTTNGSGGITGTEDFNVQGTTVSSQSSPVPFGAAYAVDPTNAGRYVLSNFTTFEGGTSYAAYPSSGGVLLLEIDGSNISVGAAYPQTAGAAFATSQGYGMNLTGVNLSGIGNGPVEVDDIAEFTASSAGTITGIIDENFAPGGSATLGIALTSGTFGTIGSGGRYGMSATAANNNTGTLLGGFTLTYYAVDGTTFPFIEVDPGQVSTGVIVLQNPSGASPAIAKSQSHMFVVHPLIRARAAKKKS